MNESTAASRKSITDSPWYWVYLFCTAGTVALVLAGPKFAARQSQIERKSEDRLRVAQQIATPEVSVVEQESERPVATRITLWPLYAVLGVVLSLAWFNLWRRHKRGQATPDSTVPHREATA